MWSSLKHRLRLAVAHRPALMLPLLRLRLRNLGPEQLVTRDTDLLIEGAGGSSNTFAHMAFAFAQERPVRLAGHTHAPAQVIRAVEWGVPVLLLIREPFDYVVSQVSRRKSKTVGYSESLARSCLEQYIHFYANLTPLKEAVHVATFQAVVMDFGEVIRQVNIRYGTDFTPFDHGENTWRACFGTWRPTTDRARADRKISARAMILEAAATEFLKQVGYHARAVGGRSEEVVNWLATPS